MTIGELQQFQDRTVLLHVLDGEILKAKIIVVDMEYEDLVVDVVETSQPEHYKGPDACYTVRAADIPCIEMN
ncbi:MAG TPA: hypothetical protein VIY69_12230 [Candidatus Acidoferrales bacterium]